MIIKIVIAAISVTLLANLLKNDFKSGALLLSVAGCMVFFSIAVGMLADVTTSFEKIIFDGGINENSVKTIIKILAISYITSFGADICIDAGEKALSNAVECVGKVTMIGMVFPMLADIFKSISDMIG